MAKVNADKYAEHIKIRINQRFNFWMRENEKQLAELKSKFSKDYTKEQSQDHALETIILESSIATIRRAIEEVKEIKL